MNNPKYNQEEDVEIAPVDENVNDKRYTEPFEDDGAYADDFID